MLILKVKNRMVSVSRMVVNVLVIYHHNCECVADGGAVAHCHFPAL